MYHALTEIDQDKYGSKFLNVLKKECPSIKEMQEIFKGTQYELQFYNVLSILPSVTLSQEERTSEIAEVANVLGIPLEDQKEFCKKGLEVAQRHQSLYYEGCMNARLSKIAFLEFDSDVVDVYAEKAIECARKYRDGCRVDSNGYKCSTMLCASVWCNTGV